MHNCCLRQLGRIDYASALQLQQQLATDRKQGLVRINSCCWSTRT